MYEQNNGNDNDEYSYTMVILEQNSKGINIAIICQFNKNILGGDEEYKYGLDTICQVIYNEIDTDKEKNKDKEYYIYMPDNNYGVGKLSKMKYDEKKSDNDVLFKVFIIKNVAKVEGNEIFSITIDSDKFVTIDRFDIVKKDVSPATLAKPADDLNKLDKSLFLLLYYISFHSFNVRFFSQLNNKFFEMTIGGITTTEPLQPPPESQQKTPVEPQPESQQKTPVKSQPPVKSPNKNNNDTSITGIRKDSNGKEVEYVIKEPDKEEAEAEAEKEAKIKKAEAKKEAKIKKAEAKKKTEAEKEAKIKKAEAKKKAEAERNKAKAERNKAEAKKKAEAEAEENNYKLEDIVDNEKEEDDYNFVPHIYNKATKKLIKYLFKNYKGTSEQKFSNLLEFPPDKKPITKGDFIDLFLDKTSKEYAEIWFNAEFPKPDNIVIIDNLLAAIKKNRYKVIYNEVAKKEKEELELQKKETQEEVDKLLRVGEQGKKKY